MNIFEKLLERRIILGLLAGAPYFVSVYWADPVVLLSLIVMWQFFALVSLLMFGPELMKILVKWSDFYIEKKKDEYKMKQNNRPLTISDWLRPPTVKPVDVAVKPVDRTEGFANLGRKLKGEEDESGK